MKIASKGPIWGIIVGIPLLAICVVGVIATAIGWVWLDEKCKSWYDEIYKA